jgi:CheY-like chemotaxis protein
VLEIDSTTAVHILLVEDDPGDVFLTREALLEGKLVHTLRVIADGEAASHHLLEEVAVGAAPRPDLIILDLNLPRLSGHEVLARIKAQPALRAIPCVVLTTSLAEIDILRSYRLNANAYITKPVDLRTLAEAIRQLEDLYFVVVRQPAPGVAPAS